MIDLHEGHQLPDVFLPRLGGEWTRLSRLLSRITIIYLWASWDKHRQGLQVLQEFSRQNEEKVSVVGIAYDVQSHSIPMRYVKKYGVTYPVLLDNYCHLSRYWGVKRLPIMLVVDSDAFIDRIEKEPTKVALQRALMADLAGKRTRIFEPVRIPAMDARVEALLQQVTNLLGRNRSKDAVQTLREASRLMPDNRIISDQIDVLEHPDKYFKD